MPLHLLRVLVALAYACAAGSATARGGEVCGPEAPAACAPARDGASAGTAPSPDTVLTFYWGIGCPHCEEARPFVEALAREHALRVEAIEVRRDADGRARYLAEVSRLRITAPGIPLFVAGDAYVLGFTRGRTDDALTALARRATTGGARASSPDAGTFDVPLLGAIEPRRVPLGLLTAVVGLADGLNPCAMWVLVVLLGVLAGVKSRRRVLALGAAFVLVSGGVYFAFMTAWSGVFAALGGSRRVTVALGIALLLMGLVNAKDVFLFRRGVSLTIPDAAKPALYRRMRRIVNASSLGAALVAVLALALLANLVELGCTIGLPALYTRVLSLRELAAWERVAWLAAYNVFYVVPLAAIVVAWAVAAPTARLGERGARLLKGISGVLLIAAGVVLLAAPGLLA